MKNKMMGLALSLVFAAAALAPASHAAPKIKVNALSKSILPNTTVSSTTASKEMEFIQRINVERTKRGLNALIVDPLLMQTAAEHSRDMGERDYFSHHSPAPAAKTPMLRYIRALENGGGEQPDSLLVGENIYYCSVYTKDFDVKYSHQALMDSPQHRANILEPRYLKIGVGVFIDPMGQFYVTEMFLRDTPENV